MLPNSVGIALERLGRGPPLLLLHGTGGSRYHWQPVIHHLVSRRKLLLVDLPGHGGSSPPPPGVAHTATGYAQLLARLLDELRFDSVHVAGNSLGGWTALELAKLGRARSVVALAPAGLWGKRPPLSARVKLRTMYRVARLSWPFLPTLLDTEIGRRLVFGGMVANPAQLPAEAALEIAASYADTESFAEHLTATGRERFRDGREIQVPVTIAWGTYERLIPSNARLRVELPSRTRYATLDGCGHLPMWDDPRLVATTILDGTGTRVQTAVKWGSRVG